MMIIKIYKIFPQVKVESLNQQNYYKFAAYATKNLADDVAHKPKCNTQYYITAIW
jgi:hypothetical protein